MKQYFIDGLNTDKGQSCFSGNIQKLLEFHGIALSEYMVSGLIEYLGFFYFPDYIRQGEFVKGAVSKEQVLLDNIKSKLNLTFIKHVCDTQQMSWKDCKEQILSNKPVLASIDDYFLPYSEYYNKIHNLRTIVIYGFDESKSLAYIIDIEPKKLELKKLSQARNSCFGGEGLQYRWFEFLAPGIGFSLDKVIITSTLNTCNNMLSVPDTKGQPSGIQGMKYFADDMDNWQKKYDETILRDILFDTFKFLSRPSGTKTSRYLFGNFLKESSQILRNSMLGSLSEEYLKLTELWETIANLFFKASRADFKKVMPRIHSRIHEIAETEENLYVNLKNALAINKVY